MSLSCILPQAAARCQDHIIILGDWLPRLTVTWFRRLTSHDDVLLLCRRPMLALEFEPSTPRITKVRARTHSTHSVLEPLPCVLDPPVCQMQPSNSITRLPSTRVCRMLGILAARVRATVTPSLGRAHPIAPPSHVAKRFSSYMSTATVATWLWIYDEVTVRRMFAMRPEKPGVAPLISRRKAWISRLGSTSRLIAEHPEHVNVRNDGPNTVIP
jgi:hypothetical protein